MSLCHLDIHMGQKWSRSSRKSTKNGVGRHHFRALLGCIGAPAWAHLGPNLPIWSHHMVNCGYWWKMLLEMLISAVFSQKSQNRAKKPLFAIISVIYFRGRLLRFLHLLLQFLTDLDNSFCILFTIGWTNFLMFQNFEFLSQNKMATIWFRNFKKNKFANFQAVPFWSEMKIRNSKLSKS